MCIVKMGEWVTTDLHKRTMDIYAKKLERYMETWYADLLKASDRGEFETVLCVPERDCEDGEPIMIVKIALQKIKETFPGVVFVYNPAGMFYRVKW